MTNHCKPYKEQLVEHQKRLEEIRRNNELIRAFPTKEETATIEGFLLDLLDQKAISWGKRKEAMYRYCAQAKAGAVE